MNDPRFRDRPRAPPPPQDGERLQKVLADAGVFSRRDAEFAIRAGRLRVNGRRVTELPCLVDPARDPGGRANVVDMVRAVVPAGERVYPVGRLDADSTGLVLLTNDGELAHRLAHPSSGIAKEYRVAIQGALSQEAMAQLGKGMYLAEAGSREGGAKRAALRAIRVLKRVRDRRRGDLSLVSITLTEGQNREIRRLFARVDIKVKSLERVALGSLALGRLPRGHFRALRGEEILALRRSVRLG